MTGSLSTCQQQLNYLKTNTSAGEGNGNPLQCSCLENPRDRGAWWAASMGSHRVRHDWSDLAAAAAIPRGDFQKIMFPKLWSSDQQYHLPQNLMEMQMLGTHSRPIVVVQSLSHVLLFVTPWAAACQASLAFTVSWSLLRFISTESVILLNMKFRWAGPVIF